MKAIKKRPTFNLHRLTISEIAYNDFLYDTVACLSIKVGNPNRIENSLRYSEVGENKQLLIAIVGCSFYYYSIF